MIEYALAPVIIINTVVIAAVLWLNRVTPRRISRFARRFDLPQDESTAAGIRDYLKRAARWRLAAALLCYTAAHTMPLFIANFPGNTLAAALVGYLVGAIIGESFAPRLPDASAEPRRRAIAVERRLADYVPLGLMRRLWLAPAVTVAVLAAGAVLPWHRDHGLTGWHLRNVAVELAAVVVLLVAAAVGQRRVLERPQPASSDMPSLRLDDALRAASLQALAGAGTALGFLVLGDAFWEVGGGTGVQLLRWTYPWLGLVSFFLALLMWTRATTDARWRQRLPLSAAEEGLA